MNPWTAERSSVRSEFDIARVALGLAETSGNVFYAALRFNHADTAAFDEKRIVHRPAFRGPFGDRNRLARLRSSPICITQLLAVDDPACGTQLIVNQDAGGRLIQFDLFSLLDGELRQQIKLCRRRGFCLGLDLLQGSLGLSSPASVSAA